MTDPVNPNLISRLFVPILAGATLKDRLIACAGALVGLSLTAIASRMALGSQGLPFIVAPMGASAVLLFAVPASPLAQPWSILGGNVISALVGVAVARLVPDTTVAAGLAVALAILAMSFTRCLHPPGGAAALTAVIGGPAITGAGFLFPFVPVGVNSIIMIVVGYLFHRLSRRSWPHRPARPASTHKTTDLPALMRVGFRTDDIDAALASMHETFDIDRDDLDAVLRQVEQQALLRNHGALSVEDIMSRDVVSISADASPESARALLMEHNIRTLPVNTENGRLIGVVGLRQLSSQAVTAGDVATAARTAEPGAPAFALVPMLTDGHAHAVVITDRENRVAGLVTQTDLLAAAARELSVPMTRNP